jgi:hypothetical protein
VFFLQFLDNSFPWLPHVVENTKVTECRKFRLNNNMFISNFTTIVKINIILTGQIACRAETIMIYKYWHWMVLEQSQMTD